MTDRDGLGWGILATGHIAGDFTRDLHDAGLRVAAVGSRTTERARSFAAEHDVPNAHGTWEALVSDPSVDVVYVATPHPAHAEAALLALEHGKHVLVEKPFTLNAREAEAVVHLARARGLVALEAMWTRWLPHMLEIHEVLRSGEIGDPQLLLADHTQSLPKDPGHRINDPALGGGALLDLGVYPISFAVDLFGLPADVQVAATFTTTGVDQRVSGTFVHDDGRHTVFSTASDLKGPNRAAIVATGGSIDIDPVWYTPTGYTVRDERGEVVRTGRPATSGRGMQYQALELERLVREGRTESERLPAAQVVGIMALLDEIRRRIGLVYPGEATQG
ncbi:Gfo/Idh/MocA family oxidoreductase [Amnibacterium sp. CER49]|uniref:Gfo/Idh/MocA family protein n=1 Tax=Amnibacterium sp. CER49 TaxID=3039161 RepID=UPI00244C495B|nr:Gfo/Idh/MocA family oxidoreductase [Amnibacterium sp. CER49]MDH2443197.1 Gfo/Idh/MocA family oxidoreductase [Amnibacterium sp. CER49]